MRDHLVPIIAAIQTPPHMPNVFFENAKNTFRALEDRIAQGGARGDKLSRALDDLTSDRFRDPVRELPARMRSMVWELAKPHSERYYNDTISKEIQHALELSKVRGGIEDSLKRMIAMEANWGAYSGFLESYKDFTQEYSDFLKNLEYAERQDPDDAQQYQALARELAAYRNSLNAIYKYISLYFKFASKVRAFLLRTELKQKEAYSWGPKGEKHHPPHKPIEVLYHAGTDIPSILKQGFKTRAELGEEKAALGGGPSDVISFTADIEIAKAIVDSLRDMVRIANGELTFEDIERMAQQEGLDPKIFEDVKQSYGRRERPPGFPDFVYTDDDSPYRNPKKLAFEAYRLTYLTYSQLRYNPAFFGVSVENFTDVKPESIGIVAAKVQMDQATEYLQTMEEFRVPTSAILSVKRVLY